MMSTEILLCRPPPPRPWVRRAPSARAAPPPRKPRSRSSPVRPISTPSPERRARSPSVSPPRFSPARPALPCAGLDYTYLHRVTQREGLFCNSAFFSVRPPTAPMRLVPWSAGGCAPAPTAPATPFTASPSPPPPLRDTTIRANSRGRRASRRLVRRLLAELTACLPLANPAPTAPPAPPSIAVLAALSTPPAPPADYDAPPSRPGLHPSCPTTSLPACNNCMICIESQVQPAPAAAAAAAAAAATTGRNVAVQAPAHRPMRGLGSGLKDNTPQEAEPQAWMGDVRVLRDLHVRLVQRQLRHIARLNYALDHAARPAAPAGAVSAEAKPPPPDRLHALPN